MSEAEDTTKEAAGKIDATVRAWAREAWSPRPERAPGWRGALDKVEHRRPHVVLVTGEWPFRAASECFNAWVDEATGQGTGGELIVPVLSTGVFGPAHVHPALAMFSALGRVLAAGDTGRAGADKAWIAFVDSVSVHSPRPAIDPMADIRRDRDACLVRDLRENFERMVDRAVDVVRERERLGHAKAEPARTPMFAVFVDDLPYNLDRAKQVASFLSLFAHPRLCVVAPAGTNGDTTRTLANLLPSATRVET